MKNADFLGSYIGPNGALIGIDTGPIPNLPQKIQNAYQLGKSKIYLSFRAVNDVSTTDLVYLGALELTITFGYHVSITASNSFFDYTGINHGTILVNDTIQTAPYDFTGITKTDVKLEAISNQTDNLGYKEIWNINSCSRSFWSRNGSFMSYVNPYTFNVSSADDRKIYLANFYQNKATTNGTLASNETWDINETLTGNVTIPSGITLTINSCATVTLNSGVKLIVNGGGTLIANGATFRGNGSAGSWNSIWFAANSYGTIQSCTIRDAQCGIYATSNANITVSNCTITNNQSMDFRFFQMQL